MTIKPPIIYRKRVRKDAEVEYGSRWIEYTFKDHIRMSERLKKTLYYGKQPITDRPSLPMTEIAVEMFSEAVPQSLGNINMNFAASVSRNACMSPCSMILAMAYLERLRTRRPEYLQNISSSNLFLVSMLVASKFLYDEGEDEEVFNDEWAQAAQMETKEINDLEMKFLAAIDWNVYLKPQSFKDLLAGLEHAVAGRKSNGRGWCTYTDIDVLTEHLDHLWCWKLLSELIIKVLTVSAIAYTASALVLVGSSIAARHIEHTVKEILSTRSDSVNVNVGCVDNSRLSDGLGNDSLLLLTGNDMGWTTDLNSFNTGLVNPNYECKPNSLIGKESFLNDCSMCRNGCGKLRSAPDNERLEQNFIPKINISAMADYLLNLSPSYVDMTITWAFR